MRHILAIIFSVLSFTTVNAQLSQPEWYILEPGASVGIIKPGVNDITYYLAASNNKPVDKAAVESMINRVSFNAGSALLVYAKVNDTYIATDMEGRNLVVKGNITKVQRGNECTVGYLKTDVTEGDVSLKKASYVWVKSQKNNEAVIQCAGNKTITVPASKLYDINATTAEMSQSASFKKVE